MLLCDRCNCGFHMGCLDPPLSVVPAGDWFCSHRLNEKFGFGNTRVFKYHQFERQVSHGRLLLFFYSTTACRTRGSRVPYRCCLT